MQNLKEYEIQNNKLSDTIKKLRYDLQECQKQQEDLCQLQANIKNRLEELEKEQKKTPEKIPGKLRGSNQSSPSSVSTGGI